MFKDPIFGIDFLREDAIIFNDTSILIPGV